MLLVTFTIVTFFSTRYHYTQSLFTFILLQRRQVARSQSPPVAAPIASPARSASFRSAVATTQIRGHTNVTLVLGSHAGGLGINGSDGRSLLSSRPEVACVPLVTPARVIKSRYHNL